VNPSKTYDCRREWLRQNDNHDLLVFCVYQGTRHDCDIDSGWNGDLIRNWLDLKRPGHDVPLEASALRMERFCHDE
jgi:hypothetical protein